MLPSFSTALDSDTVARPRAAALVDDLARDRVLRAGDPQPFEELLVPIVRRARAALERRLEVWPAVFSEAAVVDLERVLLKRLVTITDQACFAELSGEIFERAAHTSAADTLADLLAAPGTSAGRTAYRAFVERIVERNSLDLFSRYPVMARLVESTLQAWVESTSACARHLADDLPRLARTFADGTDLGAVQSVVANLSDPHRGGRTVCRITFERGLEVIYKPRRVALDDLFGRTIAWLNVRGLPLQLRAPVTIDAGDRGWVECVNPRPCESRSEVERFYVRAGMLTCLAYVLGVGDLHRENLIAAGEHPVIVDLEVLGTSPVRLRLDDASPTAAGTVSSVYDTGLLPLRRPIGDGGFERSGGLAAGAGRHRREWRWPNTDRMRPVQGALPPKDAHLPKLGDTRVSSTDWLPAIVRGFGAMYAVIEQHRAPLAGASGPLASLAVEDARMLVRNTSTYTAIVRRLQHPTLLRDEAAWTRELDTLQSALVGTGAEEVLAPVVRAEQRALAALDIPMFSVRCDSIALAGDRAEIVVESFAVEPGRQALDARLRALSDRDRRSQEQIVRASFTDDWDEQIVVDPVAAIATRFERTSFAPAPGETSWIGHGGPEDAPGQGMALGWDLYRGRSGIALYLAAVAAARGDQAARALALRTFAPMHDRALMAAAFADDWRIGAGIGAGGFIYAAVRSARLLSAESLLDVAESAAHTISADAIARDTWCDVMLGSPGAALGLLALHGVRPSAAVLDTAVRCGVHILSHTPASPHRAAQVATGFAHGSTGAACALARLYRATGDERFRAGALDAIRDSVADVDGAVTSPQSRVPVDEALRYGWCRGWSGRGLAWLACADALDLPDLRATAIALADRLATVLDARTHPIDAPCCGTPGSIAFLHVAGQVSGRADLVTTAADAARHLTQRAAARGSFAAGASNDNFAPGFFVGLAGIGHVLLGLEAAGLPNVFCFE